MLRLVERTWENEITNKIKNAGGYEVDEVLRGNAMGGGCLMIVTCIAWSYFICSALSTLVLYMAGVEENYWK